MVNKITNAMRGRNDKTVFIFKNKQIKLVKFAIFCGAQDTLTNPNKRKIFGVPCCVFMLSYIQLSHDV